MRAEDRLPEGSPDAVQRLVAGRDWPSAYATGPSPSFGDYLLELESTDMRVRVGRERSQWFIEVSGRDWDARWFTPVEWRAYLDGRDGAGEPSPVDVQAAMLLKDEARIRLALRTRSAEASAKLAELRASSMRRLLG